MGDFNAIISCKDKVGGSPCTLNKLIDFRECVFDCTLMDLNSIGMYYTWSNL